VEVAQGTYKFWWGVDAGGPFGGDWCWVPPSQSGWLASGLATRLATKSFDLIYRDEKGWPNQA
jgi:hypothetical protein